MTALELERWVEAHGQVATQIAEREELRLYVLAHEAKPPRERIMQVPEFDRSQDRASVRDLCRQLSQEAGIDAVGFASEAWAMKAPSLEAAAEWAGRIHTHPQRIEVLIVAGVAPGGHYVQRQWMIEPQPDGTRRLTPEKRVSVKLDYFLDGCFGWRARRTTQDKEV